MIPERVARHCYARGTPLTRLRTPPQLLHLVDSPPVRRRLFAVSSRTWARACPIPSLPALRATPAPLLNPYPRCLRSTPHRRTLLLPCSTPPQARQFHSSPSQRDIFFVTVPAIKQALLTLTRVTLIALPFAWRWKLFKRFPAASRTLWQIPIIALCLVLGLGLNQSPKTARWRLLLMTEREELEWSNQRFEELLASEAGSIVSPDDPRVKVVQSVCTRLVQALHDESPITCVNFPREEIMERMRDAERRKMIRPSARTQAAVMPFLPESSNPEKLMPTFTWDIFVIDAPKINAFVLPSTDVFVYTGLLSLVEDDENLLASVLAHELSHVTERHSVESLGALALSGVVFDVLRGASWALTLSFPIVGDALAACFNFLDRKVGQRTYSRKLETEADALGLELMARAGFDPRAALDLWEILNEVEADVREHGESGPILDNIELLRTHPTGEQRLIAIQALLPAAMKLYEATKAAGPLPTALAVGPVAKVEGDC